MGRLLDLLNEDEETAEVETPEVVEEEQGELEVSTDADEPETNEDPEEKPDFEFELEDDEPEVEKPKVTAQSALVHKLSKKNRQLQSTKTELEEAREEIERLKAGQPGAQADNKSEGLSRYDRCVSVQN